MSPPVLTAPIQDKPLILYVAAQEHCVWPHIRHTEVEALFSGSHRQPDLKSESDQICDVKTGLVRPPGQMVFTATTVRDCLCTIEDCQETSAGRFPSRSSSTSIIRALRRTPG
ncbi:hypothetical protein LIER_19153 [Lithospermum erythrorhizon]|uniref:Uncharacterized protein n=1 Tax=Lithospermum erythrorhizon TaxID=34254 RepID=A0AAV3QJD5_LITER